MKDRGWGLGKGTRIGAMDWTGISRKIRQLLAAPEELVVVDTDQRPLHVHILKCATGLWQGEAALCPTVSVSLEPIEPKAKALGVNTGQSPKVHPSSRVPGETHW